MQRRTYLATVAGTVVLAGCAGSGDDPDEDEDGSNGSENGGSNGNGDEDDYGTFDDFADLSEWSVVDGSLSADEDRTSVGSQSALLETDITEDSVMIRREFSSARDFSDRVPGLAVASESPQRPIVQLTDADGDRIDFRARTLADHSLMRYNFGVADVVGDPDLSEVVSIQIAVWSGDESGSRTWCDELFFVPRPDTGAVMVQFDYGDETAYTEGYPILEEHDIPATAFVNTDFVNGETRMSRSQLDELHDAGWTIASQSATNADLTEVDDPHSQLESAADWLSDNGFGDGAGYFAYPLDNVDESAVDAAERVHDLSFASGYPVGGYVTNTELCPRVGDPDPSEARQYLEWTAEINGITTLYYHELDSELRPAFEETMADIAEMEADGELEVITPADLESEYVYTG